VEPLAAELAEVLIEPLADPMAREWVAIPTVGMRRWLALELARSLGASTPGSGDGVAANIEFTFPGALREVVLRAGGSEGAADPWQVDSLVWALLEVLKSGRRDDRLGPLTQLAPGATWFGRARRLADLFDRYSVRRPELVQRWSKGEDLDVGGRPLSNEDLWQPHLWRLVRDRIGFPSPPERLPDLLDDLKTGALEIGLPPRLALFGLTTLPSGASFVDLIEAVAARRDLHLLLLDPSPATTSRVRGAVLAKPARPLSVARVDDASDAEMRQVRHPLLCSWGRPYRERTVLLALAEQHGFPAPQLAEVGDEEDREVPATLLRCLQRDLRAGCMPAGDFDLRPGDNSIQVHSCHGQARQVQVLRDSILHLLADDPTLREEDIVVLSPAIDRFAPLVEAGFGTSAEVPAESTGDATPRLLYRVSDRSLRESYPTLAALDTLLALLSGRFTASEMLEFIWLPAVRTRFSFSENDLETVAGWIRRANVRWGIDPSQRERWGIPRGYIANSWQAAIDRLLMGIAVSDGGIGLASGGIAPLGVEGDAIGLAGRLAELVARLADTAEQVRQLHTPAAWSITLSQAIDGLFAVDNRQQWQLDQLRRIVADIGEQAKVGAEPVAVELSLADVRRLLADRIQGDSRRPDFFRGGVTVSSLTPLRWLPFRVVCILGLDEDATSAGAGLVDGDDLAALTPLIGDRDPRSEVRQALLEAALAAGDHLVITRTGHDVRSNREVPGATVLAELRDAITATLPPGCKDLYRRQVETVHPRQAFDERCFERGELHTTGAWSFDASAFVGARARAGRTGETPCFLDGPLGPVQEGGAVVDLSELQAFLQHPAEAFFRQRLRLRLLREDRDQSDDLVISLDALDRWAVADRLLKARLEGQRTEAWEQHERALGTLPPGGLGEAALADAKARVDGVLALAAERCVDHARDERIDVDVELADGTRVVGTVLGRCGGAMPGPGLVTCSKIEPKRRLTAWLDLVAVVASRPSTSWRSVVVGRGNKDTEAMSLELVPVGDTADDRKVRALRGLETAVDCYRRGLREPVPLFGSLSFEIHENSAKASDWEGDWGGREGSSEATIMAFGRPDFQGLCSLPALPHDPPGTAPGRAKRFADYLWGAVEASAEERP
jgi:exodeoxyribonuclease V gamma subunit